MLSDCHQTNIKGAGKALSQCREAIGAACGYLSVLSSDRASIDIVILDHRSKMEILKKSIRMPVRGLKRQAVLTGKPLFRNSDHGWKHFLPTKHIRIDNLLIAPISNSGGRRYLLTMANKEGGFSAKDKSIAIEYGQIASKFLDEPGTRQSGDRWHRGGSRGADDNEAGSGAVSAPDEFFLKNVIDSLQDGISVLDGSLNILSVNKFAEEKFSDTAPLTGKKCYEAYYGRTVPCDPCPSLETLRTGQPAVQIKPMPGNLSRTVELNTFPLKDSRTGAVTGVIEVVRDITDVRGMIDDLEKSNKHLTISTKISELFTVHHADGVYGKVLGEVLRAMKSEYGVFGYVDENGDLVLPSLTTEVWDVCQMDDKKIVFPRSEWTGIWGQALNSGRTLFSNTAFKVPEGHVPIFRAMATPIIFGNETIGLLQVANKAEDYEDEDQALLERITVQVAPLLSARVMKARQEKQLKRSNEMLNGLIRSAPLAIVTVDSDLNMASWNPAAENLFGWTEEEVLGRSLPIVPKEQKAEVEELQERVLNGEVISGYETKRLRKDGTLVDVRLSTTMLGGVDEQLGGYLVALFEDISDRKRMERELIQSNQRFEDVAMASGEWFWEVDAHGRYTYSSAAAENILGYGSEEVVSRYFYDFFHPDDKEELKKAALKVFRQKGSFRNFLNMNIHRDGRTVFLETSGFPIIDERGTLIGYRGSDRDVTEKIAAENALKNSEDKFRSLFENMAEGFAYHKLVYNDNGTAVDYIFLEVNEGFEHMTGLKGTDILGKRVTEVIPGIEKDDLDWIQTYEKVAGTGEEVSFEQYSDALERWYQVHAYCPAKGNFATIIMDITERKKTEEVLRKSEEWFRILLGSGHDAIFVHSMEAGGRDQPFLEVNEAACKIYGYSREELLRMTSSEIDAPEGPGFSDELAEKFMDQGHIVFEQLHVARDGTRIPVEISARRFEFEGKPAVISIARDIRERIKAEKDLRESEERFRLTFQLNPDAICLSTLQKGVIVDANKVMEDLFGYRADEMLGKVDLELGIWKDVRDRKVLMTELMKYQRTRNAFELELVSKDEKTIHVLLSAAVVNLDGIPHILSIFKDINVIRSYEKTVNQMVEGTLGLTGSDLFLNLAQSLFEILNSDYIIISEINFAAETATSLAFIAQDVVGENFTYDLEETPCLEVFKKGKPMVYKNSLQRYFPKDRALVDLEAEGYVGVPLRDSEGSVIGILCALYKSQVSNAELTVKIMQAVSVKLSGEIIRIRIERVLKRNIHLATVGQVASGIAHEINNPLATISACTEVLQARLDRTERVVVRDSEKIFEDYLDIIQKEVAYSSGIINDLLDFSRHRSDKVSTFDLNELIESTVRLIKMQERSRGYSFELHLDEQVPECDADHDRIRQVLIIIFTNAIEAMPDGGTVEVRTRWRRNPGEVRISITDHGSGIGKSAIKRIFEPFFTTKGENKGTGLGLYLAFSIVAKHMGHIDVNSREGRGTTFTIRLPCKR